MKVFVGKSESKFEEKFEDGIYPGAIVGIRYGKSKRDDGTVKEANCFLVAVSDDEGHVSVKKSKDFSCATFNPKGNFAVMVSSILKVPNNEDDIAAALTEMGWLDEGGLEMNHFLGMNVNVSIKMEVSRKDPSKMFANITDLSKSTARVGRIELPASGTAPAFYQMPYKGEMVASEFMEGWGWGKAVEQAESATPSEPAPVSAVDLDDASIPF